MSSGFPSPGGVWAVLLAVVMLVAGCAGGLDAGERSTPTGPAGGLILGAEDNGRQVEMAAGQVLAISLPSNPTTGYRWSVAEVDAAVLGQEGEAEFEEQERGDEQLVGVGGTETLRFSAEGPGQTTLTLVYHRPWEEGVEPLESFSVEVVVR